MVAEPRLASTVILVREAAATSGGQAYQVFMVRRPVRSEFAADVYVFPGGTVRSDDLDPAVGAACAPFGPDDALRRLAERGGAPPASDHEALALHVAALRELYEEAGVLLAEPRTEAAPSFRPGDRAERLALGRLGVQAGHLSLAALARNEGLRLACEQLIYFSHWVTPRPYPRRYDTRFFVATLPAGQQALHCDIETVAGVWVTPSEALEGYGRGDFPLVLVTQRHLERIAGQRTLDDLLRFARSKPIVSVQPEVYDDSLEPFLPQELEGCW